MRRATRTFGAFAAGAMLVCMVTGYCYAAGLRPVVWYTDLVFQAVNVIAPIRAQAEWEGVLRRSWGETSAFTMNGGSSVNDCQQLFTANRKRIHVSTGAIDEQAYVLTSIGCYAAREVLHAVPARVTYLNSFKMNATDVRSLPAALSLVISNSSIERIVRAICDDKTLGDVVAKRATLAVRRNPRGNAPSVRLIDGTGGIEDISLLARGDFNHDGVEDLLITVSSKVVGGTYMQNDLYLVTRLGAKASMKVLEVFPDMGLGLPVFH